MCVAVGRTRHSPLGVLVVGVVLGHCGLHLPLSSRGEGRLLAHSHTPGVYEVTPEPCIPPGSLPWDPNGVTRPGATGVRFLYCHCIGMCPHPFSLPLCVTGWVKGGHHEPAGWLPGVCCKPGVWLSMLDFLTRI